MVKFHQLNDNSTIELTIVDALNVIVFTKSIFSVRFSVVIAQFSVKNKF